VAINPRVLQASALNFKKLALTGTSFLSITDSHLQLQEVKGLEITVTPGNDPFSTDLTWDLRGLSVEGIAARTSTNQSEEGWDALFKMQRIPLSYMRSCLLSPKFYNVVNKVLA
jgi:hypothetical protein